jgi:hypothetical protein
LLSKDGHCHGIHRSARALLLTVPEFVAPNSFPSGARSKRVENAGEFHYNALTALIAPKVKDEEAQKHALPEALF